MEFHEIANLFPLMEGEEYAALVADIRENGLREKIWLYEGRILDGRNRFRACRDANVEPRFRQWKGKGSPSAFVVSLNLHRRHLDESQRAMVGARIATMRQGERTDIQPSANSQKVSRAEAAKLLNVSTRTISDAAKVIEHATAELAEAVDTGLIAVSQAAKLADETPATQRKAVKAVTEGKKANAVVKELKREKQIAAIETMPAWEGKYHVIVVDPPWKYHNRADDSTHRAANPYPSMSLEDIEKLPVSDLAQDNSVLWLWTTNAFMVDAHAIVKAWGFEVKTILTWAKDKMGLGDWLRGQTEHCLLAVKGKPVVRLTNQTTLLHGPLREHSRKPDEFYQLVDALCVGTKCELFSREEREGWACLGAEVELFVAA